MTYTYNPQQSIFYDDDPGEKLDPAYLIGIFKRKIRFFVVPFFLVTMLGFGLIEIQRPIYRSEGRILVESPEIPPDLVRPTITEVAEERVQIIQQRILARDNLLAVANKYNLFAHEHGSMSGTELLDSIRSRVDIKPVEPNVEPEKRSTAPTIAFTLSFEYEVPEIAMKVANEFLTEILSEDASKRTKSATETTKFLEREVKRLQGEHDAVIAQLAAAQQRNQQQQQQLLSQQASDSDVDEEQPDAEELKTQQKHLADLEAALAQKSSVYAAEHPVIKDLQRNIAELKRIISSAPQPPPARKKRSAAPANARVEDVDLLVLERQEANVERNLEEAAHKLEAARLGESMERGQQGERLQVIEQPSLPQKPVRPQKLKWFAVAVALAGVIGIGCVILAETFDDTLRGSRELVRIIDRQLIVTIPYLPVPGEELRTRLNLVLLCAGLVGVLAVAIAIAVAQGVSIDFNFNSASRLGKLL